jgi:hypothetical protein
MTETQHPRRIGRSIVALLTRIFAGVILTVLTDILLHVTGVLPPWGQPTGDALLLLATAYRIPFNIAGSYVVARLAPDWPMQHVLVSGVVGVVAGTVGGVTTWDKGPWLTLVSTRSHRTWDALRLGRRQTPREAGARTHSRLREEFTARHL